MSDWPTLSWDQLSSIMFAYHEGYSKSYDRREFPNPFSVEGSQAAAWELGTKVGKEQRDYHDAFVTDAASLNRIVEPQLDSWIRKNNLVVTGDHYGMLLELVASTYAGDVLKLPTISTEQVSPMTKRKTEDILERDNMHVSGFVLMDSGGGRCIVENAVVRWLTLDQFHDLMHPGPSAILQAQVNKKSGSHETGDDDA